MPNSTRTAISINHPGFPLLPSLSGLQLIRCIPNAGYFPLDSTYVPWLLWYILLEWFMSNNFRYRQGHLCTRYLREIPDTNVTSGESFEMEPCIWFLYLNRWAIGLWMKNLTYIDFSSPSCPFWSSANRYNATNNPSIIAGYMDSCAIFLGSR